jgi:hypothetical protein
MHDSVRASEGRMPPKQREATGEGDLFQARLDQIISMKHELVQLAGPATALGLSKSIVRARRVRWAPALVSRLLAT